MNILIIGFMGSGKSSVGRALAKEKGMNFIELDGEVLKETGFDSVAKVYEERRSLWHETELTVLKHLSTRDNQVIACGGGVAENQLNFLYFEEGGISLEVLYLAAQPEVLVKRILASHEEFTLADEERIRDNLKMLFEKRNALYRLHASRVVETDEKDLFETVQHLIA